MNKIVVVGHPQSGLEAVQKLLLDCGVAQAIPSRREGFTPEQIGATLLKAHGAVPVEQVSNAEELQQIAVAPVWQGLALDLVLANMDQPLWGWADVQAVYLLDYWKVQDPQTMFVLVYDAPQTALTRHAVEHLETNPEALQAKVSAWVAYNSALLSFHMRNPERSLLVHADQVKATATHYVQQLSACMDASLQLPDAEQDLLCISGIDDGTHGGTQLVSQAEVAASSADTHAAAQLILEGNVLAQFLVQQLLEEYPEAAELYAQLQAAASMPQRSHQGKALASHDQQQRYQAWAAFVDQQTTLQQSAERLTQLDKTMQDQRQQAQEQERLLSSHIAALQSSEQESALLLTQLHQVQEELESRYLQAQDQAKKMAELPKLQAELKVALNKATKLQQTEAQLKKELQQATVKPASTELQEGNELLLSQLHKVQEELERYYLENRQLKAGASNLHPQAKQAYYGAADRVKQQLSYRLGATMIAQSRSVYGWLTMPFVLSAEAKRFKKDQAACANQKLPPIQQYRDAYEAERVKQHLSYRLGACMITNSKTLGGWVSMPWALLAEIKAFRKELR